MKNIFKAFYSTFAVTALMSAMTLLSLSGIEAHAAEDRKIDVWDMGGIEEEETATYNNNISAADWDSYEGLGSEGVFTADGEISFGDLTLVYSAGDKLYSGLSTKKAGTISNMTKKYTDRYKANGMYYCDGTGSASQRYFKIDNVKAGDKIVVYMGAHDSVSDTLVLEYMGTDFVQKDTKDFKDFKKIVFTAKYDGSYKVYTGGAAKAGYNRIVRIPGATVSGVLNNCLADMSGARLYFTNMTTGEEIDAKIVDGKYSVSLATGYEYEATLKRLFGYEIEAASVEIKEGDVSINLDLTVNKVDLVYYDVKGGFLNGEAAKITAIEFVDVDEGFTYAGTITSDGFTVKLIDGAYEVNVTSDTYKTSTHIVVKGQDVEKDLMMTKIKEEKITLERVDKIYVGYADKSPNYATVREALAAAQAMNPTSEEERIVISIAPGTYREQLVINTPYLTLINETDKEVLLTWYYGVGYMYYSADEKGFYNEEKAYDKYEKHEVANWGCTVKINSSAKAFRAENIVFESSFNRYVTEEEIADGVQVSGGTAITFQRKLKSVVTSKAATERAAAAYVNADKSEFLNCSFLSSQDTLFTGNVSAYFKGCFIEGNTDFIFGDGNVVFDACEISLYGYSSGETAGYITAASTDINNNGYLFRNCAVTADSLKIQSGYAFGRPWRPNAKVTFENTKLKGLVYICAQGWKTMSDNTPENARYAEYNTTDFAGNASDVSGRVAGTVKDAPMDFTYESFLGFVPVYSVATEDTVAFETTPRIINTYGEGKYQPGHVLKAEYSLGAANDANDCSIVEWYRVLDGVETLVKTSSVIVDDTYTLKEADAGALIKMVVRPENVDGTKGEAASYISDEPVSDEPYVEPEPTTTPEPETTPEPTTEPATTPESETIPEPTTATQGTTGDEAADNRGSSLLALVAWAVMMVVVIIIIVMKIRR